MSIAADYTRDGWERNGGWVGVETYVDAVTLRFAEDYDEREDAEPITTRTPISDHQVYVKTTQTLPYRDYLRVDGETWELIAAGEREFSDSIIVGVATEAQV